jgi:hypothetical protein
MNDAGGLTADAVGWIEDLSDLGLAARTEYYSGAELAGLVRSAASFALGRTIDDTEEEAGIVTRNDFELSLQEVKAAFGKQDDHLKMRYPFGISACSTSIQRVMRDLERFTRPIALKLPRIHSLLLVGSGGGGAGVTGLAAWAAARASSNGVTDFVRLITSLDLITASEGGSEAARAAALAAKFDEAKEMPHSLIVFDDIDQLCAGNGAAGYSSVMIATLRALLRSPPAANTFAKAGGATEIKLSGGARTMHIIATTSRADAACLILNQLFDETIGEFFVLLVNSVCPSCRLTCCTAVVPYLERATEVALLLQGTEHLSDNIIDPEAMAQAIIKRLNKVGIKKALRIAERVLAATIIHESDNCKDVQANALESILEDISSDSMSTQTLCEMM